MSAITSSVSPDLAKFAPPVHFRRRATPLPRRAHPLRLRSTPQRNKSHDDETGNDPAMKILPIACSVSTHHTIISTDGGISMPKQALPATEPSAKSRR